MKEVAPGQTLDQYEIEDVIARSGMSTIFRARDSDGGKDVVVKVPHLQLEADIVFHERFLREEEIGLRLDHPSIVKVLRPRDKSRVYLVQELVQGESLRDLLRRVGRMPIDDAVRIVVQLAEALDYLHREGVVHRDMKPENVILTPGGGLKLMDFGIAYDATLKKMTWSGLSHAAGTPDYMAPEQIEGKRGEPRSDLYSLGAMLYEMLTGQVPFPQENAFAAMKAKVATNPTAPRQLRPEISPGLEEAILVALERDPQKRPETAFEFEEMLKHSDSLPLSGRAARSTEPPRASQRWRSLLAVVVAVILYALILGGVWVASRAIPHPPAVADKAP
jgi:serine/threonine-protein kinase